MLPDIDYFVVFILWLLHGKKERSELTVASEEKINLIRNLYGSNLRNWAILRRNDWNLITVFVLAPVQLIRSVPST